MPDPKYVFNTTGIKTTNNNSSQISTINLKQTNQLEKHGDQVLRPSTQKSCITANCINNQMPKKPINIELTKQQLPCSSMIKNNEIQFRKSLNSAEYNQMNTNKTKNTMLKFVKPNKTYHGCGPLVSNAKLTNKSLPNLSPCKFTLKIHDPNIPSKSQPNPALCFNNPNQNFENSKNNRSEESDKHSEHNSNQSSLNDTSNYDWTMSGSEALPNHNLSPVRTCTPPNRDRSHLDREYEQRSNNKPKNHNLQCRNINLTFPARSFRKIQNNCNRSVGQTLDQNYEKQRSLCDKTDESRLIEFLNEGFLHESINSSPKNNAANEYRKLGHRSLSVPSRSSRKHQNMKNKEEKQCMNNSCPASTKFRPFTVNVPRKNANNSSNRAMNNLDETDILLEPVCDENWNPDCSSYNAFANAQCPQCKTVKQLLTSGNKNLCCKCSKPYLLNAIPDSNSGSDSDFSNEIGPNLARSYRNYSDPDSESSIERGPPNSLITYRSTSSSGPDSDWPGEIEPNSTRMSRAISRNSSVESLSTLTSDSSSIQQQLPHDRSNLNPAGFENHCSLNPAMNEHRSSMCRCQRHRRRRGRNESVRSLPETNNFTLSRRDSPLLGQEFSGSNSRNRSRPFNDSEQHDNESSGNWLQIEEGDMQNIEDYSMSTISSDWEDNDDVSHDLPTNRTGQFGFNISIPFMSVEVSNSSGSSRNEYTNLNDTSMPNISYEVSYLGSNESNDDYSHIRDTRFPQIDDDELDNNHSYGC